MPCVAHVAQIEAILHGAPKAHYTDIFEPCGLKALRISPRISYAEDLAHVAQDEVTIHGGKTEDQAGSQSRLRRARPRLRPAAPNKITLKHLAAGLAEEHQLTKKQGEAMLNDLVMLITKHLKKGERIRLAGLGILQVRKRAARMGRNPATGEAIKIKASKKVAFRAVQGTEDGGLSFLRSHPLSPE